MRAIAPLAPDCQTAVSFENRIDLVWRWGFTSAAPRSFPLKLIPDKAMSNQDHFFGGFILGTVVGGVVGGVVGVLAASRIPKKALQAKANALAQRSNKRSSIKEEMPTPQNIEAARRGLEDKIAQLNDAIDDVRQKLGTVNGDATLEAEEVMSDRPD